MDGSDILRMCDECGLNPANVHLTQIMKNESHVYNLCEACAKKKGISITVNKQILSNDNTTVTIETDKACSRCGCKLSEFRAKGWLGCPSCYQAFEKEINELLIQVHGSSSHKGKRYIKAESTVLTSDNLKRLRNELAAAIKNEQFEQAATIRDTIHNLQQPEQLLDNSLK